MDRRHSVSASGPAAVSAGRDISGDVTTHYEVSLQGTPLRLAVQNVSRIGDLVRIAEFTGRKWLYQQCTEFFDRNDSGYFVVEADAGLGKTTFAAWLVAEHHHLGHFTRLPGGRMRTAALRNLSAQLIDRFDLFPDMETQFVLPGLNRAVVPEWVDEPANFARLPQKNWTMPRPLSSARLSVHGT